MPMHVGGLQLFKKPEGAGRNYIRNMYDEMVGTQDIAPLFLKRPHRSIATAGQWVWENDEQFDIEHHVRHSALPKPGRVRELLELCSRLHGTRLARERPLWEAHIIEGLRDGRVAMYTKTHHSLVDGISAMRLLASVLSTDPDERDMPAMWATMPKRAKSSKAIEKTESSLSEVPVAGAADRARHHRRGRRHARGPGQDALQGAAERDLVAVPLRAPDDLQPEHHRLPPVRRPALADRAAARHRQGHRRHPQRRRAGDVRRRHPAVPPRARRASRRPPGGDGAGRPQRQAVPDRLLRGRQRGRLGHGPARDAPARPRRPARDRSTGR